MRFLKTVGLIQLGVLTFAAVLSLLFRANIGVLLFWLGLAMLAIGSYAAIGGWKVAPNEYNLNFDQKMPQRNYERTPEKWSEMNKSYDFSLYMAASAIPLIIVGYLLAPK